MVVMYRVLESVRSLMLESEPVPSWMLVSVPAQNIHVFVMYCIYGVTGPSLFVEYTNSMMSLCSNGQ